MYNHTDVMMNKLSLIHQRLRIPKHNYITHVLGEFSFYTYFNYVIIDSSLLLSNWYNQPSKLFHLIQTQQIYFNLLFPIFETQMQCHKAGGNTYRKNIFASEKQQASDTQFNLKAFHIQSTSTCIHSMQLMISILKHVHAIYLIRISLKACKSSNTNH